MPFRFRHRPMPYRFRRRAISRIRAPTVNVSTCSIGPSSSKCTEPWSQSYTAPVNGKDRGWRTVVSCETRLARFSSRSSTRKDARPRCLSLLAADSLTASQSVGFALASQRSKGRSLRQEVSRSIRRSAAQPPVRPECGEANISTDRPTQLLNSRPGHILRFTSFVSWPHPSFHDGVPKSPGSLPDRRTA